MALVIAKLDNLFRGWHTTVLVLGHFLLLALGTSLVVAPRTAYAQDILVKRFTDLTGKAKFGQKAKKELSDALIRKGATLRDTKEYLTRAKKKRIPVNEAFLGPNIKKISKVLTINAIVTGKAVVEKKKYKLALNVFNQRGAIVFKKVFVTQKPELAPEAADNIISQIYSKLGIAERSQPTTEQQSTITQPTEPQPPATSSTETALPSWARHETAAEPVSPPPSPSVPPPPTQEIEATAKPTEQPEKGSVSDVLLAVGAGLNLRHAHLAKDPNVGFIDGRVFPSIRIDGRFMLGAITDVPFVRDLGVGSTFNIGLGLNYHPVEDTTDTQWDAKQFQWHAELIYRLAINSIMLQPAFLLRFGYGMTISTIEKSGMSVSYKYPFAAIDIHLMLWKPWLRFFVSPGIMFLVQPGENVVGSGNNNLGFSLLTGLELQLFNHLAIGAGYDLSQFLIKLDGGDNTSDVYQTFFIRVGLVF